MKLRGGRFRRQGQLTTRLRQYQQMGVQSNRREKICLVAGWGDSFQPSCYRRETIKKRIASEGLQLRFKLC